MFSSAFPLQSVSIALVYKRTQDNSDVLSLQCLDLKAIIEIIFLRIERTELLTEYNNNSKLILITQCSVLLY